MAKAKLVKRKRRLRIEAIATLVFTLSIFMYLGAIFGLQSYNIMLQKEAQNIQEKAGTLKAAVANLETDVNNLENRERVVGMVESEGISYNQGNIVTIEDESSK
ncbi:cell division protein FtsL [Amedibacillus sp. YH-ame10]